IEPATGGWNIGLLQECVIGQHTGMQKTGWPTCIILCTIPSFTYRDAKDGMVHRMMHVGRHHVWDCMWHWFFLHLFLYRYLFLSCCWTIWYHLREFYRRILIHLLFYFLFLDRKRRLLNSSHVQV